VVQTFQHTSTIGRHRGAGQRARLLSSGKNREGCTNGDNYETSAGADAGFRHTGLTDTIMMIHKRAMDLYKDLFHHSPNWEEPEDANRYLLLEKALRAVAYECKGVAEQQASLAPQGLWGEGLRQGAIKIASVINRDVAK
jgi:hypothetical protein